MPTYRNVGKSAWRRASNLQPTEVPPGETFEATEVEHARLKRRTHLRNRLRLVEQDVVVESKTPPPPGETKPHPPESKTKSAKELAALMEQWPFAMKPAVYAGLHPEGEFAKLAKGIVRLQKKVEKEKE